MYDITLKEATLPHRTNLSSRGKLASNNSISETEENTTKKLENDIRHSLTDTTDLSDFWFDNDNHVT